MPMDFPDMDSLRAAAKVWKFREPTENEEDAVYREALADHVKLGDIIESNEIRFGHGWDQFTDTENLLMLVDAFNKGKKK